MIIIINALLSAHSPSSMLDAVLLEILLAPLNLLLFTISIFALPLFAFLVLLMLLNLKITASISCLKKKGE